MVSDNKTDVNWLVLLINICLKNQVCSLKCHQMCHCGYVQQNHYFYYIKVPGIIFSQYL